MSLMDLVNAHRVSYELNQATMRACGQDLIWLHPQSEILQFEDLIYLADQLHCELLLSDIIVSLDNNSQ